ncbi:hypothetical protein O3G_MSEX011225 [Manduca sexta]|uniref:Uncharacterized protein n=1 Tax=Manduca sexta TaxID=7130 RepID=A0A921ZKD1_MANSE|nr:hypothetical protein O3G_MSEX011225 [Manduca sexta]
MVTMVASSLAPHYKSPLNTTNSYHHVFDVSAIGTDSGPPISIGLLRPSSGGRSMSFAYAASPGSWSPLQKFSVPKAITSKSYVSCPLPLEFRNSMGYVGYFGSPADLFISKHSPPHCLLGDLKSSDKAHSERPRLSSICHHWQHTLVKDFRLETLQYSGREDVSTAQRSVFDYKQTNTCTHTS